MDPDEAYVHAQQTVWTEKLEDLAYEFGVAAASGGASGMFYEVMGVYGPNGTNSQINSVQEAQRNNLISQTEAEAATMYLQNIAAMQNGNVTDPTQGMTPEQVSALPDALRLMDVQREYERNQTSLQERGVTQQALAMLMDTTDTSTGPTAGYQRLQCRTREDAEALNREALESGTITQPEFEQLQAAAANDGNDSGQDADVAALQQRIFDWKTAAAQQWMLERQGSSERDYEEAADYYEAAIREAGADIEVTPEDMGTAGMDYTAQAVEFRQRAQQLRERANRKRGLTVMD